MFYPNELEAMPLPIERMFKSLEDSVMSDIVRRIEVTEEITRAADWQIHRLYELGKSKAEIKQQIKETLKLADDDIDRLYENAIQSGYARDEDLYKAAGKSFIPYSENKALQQFVAAVKEQTKEEFKNITQSLGFTVKQPDGALIFKPIAKYYQETLDKAVVEITSGVFDYNTVLKKTVAEMTNSGLRSVDYASGWSNRVEVAARRAVMTGIGQVTGKINDDNAKKLETDYFEVEWHSGARPTHQVWQGRVYSKDELVSVCGLGTGDGLKGWNCYHEYYPFIPGVSVRTYTDEELEELNAKDNELKSWKGKQYTKYEALQRQRRLETTMRRQRQKIKLLELGNASEEDISAAKARYFATSDDYVRFSKGMGIPQQRERVSIDGLGTIKQDKAIVKSGKSGIIGITKNAVGQSVIIVKKAKIKANPNSITQVANKKGGIDRNYYGNDGNQIKQISNNDHGHRTESHLGKHGEHAHDYIYDEEGKLKHGKARELTADERTENSDIL